MSQAGPSSGGQQEKIAEDSQGRPANVDDLQAVLHDTPSPKKLRPTGSGNRGLILEQIAKSALKFAEVVGDSSSDEGQPSQERRPLFETILSDRNGEDSVVV